MCSREVWLHNPRVQVEDNSIIPLIFTVLVLYAMLHTGHVRQADQFVLSASVFNRLWMTYPQYSQSCRREKKDHRNLMTKIEHLTFFACL